MPSPGRAGSLSVHSQSPGRHGNHLHGGQQHAGHFGWSAQGELGMQLMGGGQVVIETGRERGGGGGGGEDVEVMSTDSSSYSSTDSN